MKNGHLSLPFPMAQKIGMTVCSLFAARFAVSAVTITSRCQELPTLVCLQLKNWLVWANTRELPNGAPEGEPYRNNWQTTLWRRFKKLPVPLIWGCTFRQLTAAVKIEVLWLTVLLRKLQCWRELSRRTLEQRRSFSIILNCSKIGHPSEWWCILISFNSYYPRNYLLIIVKLSL